MDKITVPFSKLKKLDKNQNAYLDLLKKLIINSVYHPNQQVTEGRIWPEFPTLSMIGMPRLDNIQELALDCLFNNIDGDFIEAGIWKGGAIALMAGLLNITDAQDRRVIGVDSFEGIPPAKPDIYPADAAHVGCEKIEILLNNSQEEVQGYLSRLGLDENKNIQLIKGWFCDVLPKLKNTNPTLALVRLDGDTYESTIQALENLEPCTSQGGYIIIDDYFSWTGCKKATDDYRLAKGITSPLITVDWTCAYWKK
jgi:Macrocin-O-methyltransferase (TylF)